MPDDYQEKYKHNKPPDVSLYVTPQLQNSNCIFYQTHVMESSFNKSHPYGGACELHPTDIQEKFIVGKVWHYEEINVFKNLLKFVNINFAYRDEQFICLNLSV